jgi:segregation and condensation protein A
VREQAALIVDRLRRSRSTSFRTLIADADATIVVVARFLALLELFREGAVAFDQAEALGELTIRWTGADDAEFDMDDEFDEFDGEPPADESGSEPVESVESVEMAQPFGATGDDGDRERTDD